MATSFIKNKYLNIHIKILLTVCVLFLLQTIFYPKYLVAAVPSRSVGFQGQLFNGSTPVNSNVSAQFTFYDDVAAGSAQGSPITKTVTVTNGYFSTNFSDADLTGINFNQSLWIEVSINSTTLSPRSVVNSVPFANNAFGVFTYASAPTVGLAGSLYYNSGNSSLYVSNGTSWIAAGGVSTWQTSGSDIYFNTGNVGVGTTTPSAKLAIKGTAGSGDVFVIASSTNANMFVVKSTGNVGIGTTSPSDKLSIDGSLNLTGAFKANGDAGTSGMVLQTTGSGIQWVATSSLGITSSQWSTSGSDIYFNTGNVGVGTTTPSAKLAITGTAGSGDVFVIASSTNANMFVVKSTGNVGIGTTTPSAGLHIIKTTEQLRLGYTDSNYLSVTVSSTGGVTFDSVGTSPILTLADNTAVNGYLNPNYSGHSSYFGGGNLIGGGSATDLAIRAQTGAILFSTGGSTERVRIDTSGNVGIGTTTPSAPLHILSSGNELARFDGTNAFGSYITFLRSGVAKSYLGSSRQIYGSPFSNDDFTLYAANNLHLGTNNAARVTILSTGNVGIGTTSPSAKFSLTGNGTSTTAMLVASDSLNNQLFSIQENGYIRIGTSSAVMDSKLTISGYGVAQNTSPYLTIEHTGDANETKNGGIITKSRISSRYLKTMKNLGFRDNSFGSLNGFVIETALEYTNNAYSALTGVSEFNGWVWQYWSGSAYVSPLRLGKTMNYMNNGGLSINRPALTEIAPLTVGNGTNNSGEAQVLVVRVLDDANASTSTQHHAFSDSSDINRNSPTFGANSFDARVDYLGTYNYDHYAGFQAVPTYGSSGTMTNMYGLFSNPRINSGTVTTNSGVYIVDPQGAGTVGTNYGVYVGNLTRGTNNYALYLDGTTKSYIGGNLGIGTTSPSVKLSVVGNGQFTGVTSGTYANDLNLTADGILTTSASDIRLKENITELATSTLSKLLTLKTYTFNWKNDSSGRTDIGMIAQEVQSIFPEITFTNEVDGYMGINYSRLPALLVKGIQEQQVDINNLKQYAVFIKTKEIQTEKLCLGDDNDKVCVDKNQLRSLLLGNTNTSSSGERSIPTENNSSTKEELTSTESDPQTTDVSKTVPEEPISEPVESSSAPTLELEAGSSEPAPVPASTE